jgi:hypothetical protein
VAKDSVDTTGSASHSGDRRRGLNTRTGTIVAAVIGAVATIAAAAIGLTGSLLTRDKDPVSPTSIHFATAPVAHSGRPTSSAGPTIPSHVAGPPQREAREVNWDSTGREYTGEVRQEVAYACPARGIPQQIWGTDLYTIDSSVCTAAVHAGKIDLAAGGRVVIRIREGAQLYTGSTRHGISSGDWGSYYGSFEFK